MNLLLSLFDRRAPGHIRALRIALVLLLMAACAFRIWLVFTYNPVNHLWSDPERHWLNGTRPMDLSPMVAIDPVRYQIYIGALAKLTLRQPLLVAYWTALLSLAGPWLWYRFLRELLPSRDWALAGWVILAALPSWSSIYSYFMQETLMLPLLGAALWMTWRCRRKADTASFVLAVAVWMAAGAKDITGKLLAIFFPIWLFITSGFEHSVANLYFFPAAMLLGAPIGVDAAIGLARSRVPDARFLNAMLPTRPDQPLRVALVRDDHGEGAPPVTVVIDPLRRTVMDVLDPRAMTTGERFLSWQRALHYGQGLGALYKGGVFAIGVIIPLFAITGACMWWIKRRNRRAGARAKAAIRAAAGLRAAE